MPRESLCATIAGGGVWRESPRMSHPSMGQHWDMSHRAAAGRGGLSHNPGVVEIVGTDGRRGLQRLEAGGAGCWGDRDGRILELQTPRARPQPGPRTEGTPGGGAEISRAQELAPPPRPGLTPVQAAWPGRLRPTSPAAPLNPPQNLAAQPPPGRRAHPPAPPPGARWSDDTAGCVANRRGPPGGGGLGHAPPRAVSQ